jgi:hypothetical protein
VEEETPKPLEVYVRGARAYADPIGVPRLGAMDLTVPGTESYEVELRAVITGPENFERWRKLVGTFLDVSKAGGVTATLVGAESTEDWQERVLTVVFSKPLSQGQQLFGMVGKNVKIMET